MNNIYYSVLGLFLYCFTPYANANLIQNSSFEFGDPFISNSAAGVMTIFCSFPSGISFYYSEIHTIKFTLTHDLDTHPVR